MSNDSNAVKVKILEKEYLVACPEDEVDALQASAKYLSQRMVEIRESGKVVGMDRIAVMAALNLAHEVIANDSRIAEEQLNAYGNRIRHMNVSIEEALGEYPPAGLN